MSKSFPGTMTVAKTGVRQASGAASAGTTIPVCLSGEVPRFIRVAATVALHIRIGVGAQTAVNTDILVQPGDAVILHVPGGYTHFAVIQSAAAGVAVITPLENL